MTLIENVPSTVLYFRHPGTGAVSEVKTLTPDLTVMPEGFEPITAEQYEAFLADLDAGNRAELAAADAVDLANIASDYAELRVAGISDAAARRLSTYAGPAIEDLDA
jgi:hypothetical protein